MKEILIIGNGIAGITAANEIRRLDQKSKITIASRESENFFSRTALMYEFCGQMSRKNLEPFESNHYERMNFQRISDEAISVDPQKQIVEFKKQAQVEYDQLLLACGSQPARIPWHSPNLTNVGTFVTLNDLEWLKAKSAELLSKGKNKVAIIGGGLIGIEVAEILALAGFEVSFIIREKWFWPIALNSKESPMIARNMREHGVNVMLETEVAEPIVSNNEITGFNLNTGQELDVDLVMVSIGVSPVTGWLQDSGIKLSEDRFKAIEANDHLETNFENIYTAGDCANVTWFNGVRRPEQLWYTGRDQGLIAGKNICGQKKTYARGILYNSAKLFDVEYTTAGLVNFPLEGLSEWYQENPKEYLSQRIVIQEGKVIGFNMLGSRWDHTKMTKWIEEGRDLEFVLENLDSARFDAEFTPKFKILKTAETYAL